MFRLALASHLTGCNILRDVSSVIGFQRDSESLKVPSALGSRGKKKMFESDDFQAIPKNYMERNV